MSDYAEVQKAVREKMGMPDLRVDAEGVLGGALPQVVDHPPKERKADPRRWTKGDLALQAALAGISYYDALHTARFLKQSPNHVEANPLLGKRPSTAKLLGATTLGQLAHVYLGNKLPGKWRTAWQMLPLTTEALVVASNHGYKPLGKVVGRF